MKFKIGQEVVVDENFTIQSVITSKTMEVKMGDKGIIDSEGNLHLKTGNAKGKIIPYTEKENLKGYDIQNIAQMIFKRLNDEFHLADIIYAYDIEKEDFIDAIESVFYDYFK